MEQIQRYAVYYAPRAGAFADRAAAWLGRDAASGAELPRPRLAGLPQPLEALTRAARLYGFHGTIRAPFRMAPDASLAGLQGAVAGLAGRLAPVTCDGLRLENLHGFLTLTPLGDVADLMALGAAVVEGTDPWRAPLAEAERARRKPETLSPRQRALLDRWGYPYVFEEFRFHLTLTDRLAADQAPAVGAALAAYIAPVLPRPFAIEDLCLFGEDGAGLFHLLDRYALTG